MLQTTRMHAAKASVVAAHPALPSPAHMPPPCSSARVYEHSTEVLFFGRQDAMQRTTLLPVAEYLRASGKAPEDVRLIEVAAGTGRFHTFLKDAYPRMPTVCSDLSPFYLARAR